jgi:hypothetical protein
MVKRYARFEFRSSTDRLARLGDVCSADGLSEGDLMSAGELLLDTDIRGPDANEYCSVFNPCTIYSTLFAPLQKRMWLRVADRADRSFEPIDVGT